MSILNDNFVNLVLVLVVAVIILSTFVVILTPETQDIEKQKIRFAAAIFTGILLLIVFTSVLYFADPDGTRGGKEIFDKVFAGLTPIAGGIIGYVFAAKNTKNNIP